MRDRLLLLNVLVVASAALVYELLCGTIASYLLGNSVREFALVLGTYLFAMGAGAWLSGRFEPRAATRYVEAELVLATIGGFAVPLLLAAASAHLPLRPLLYALVFIIGAIVGLELPLLVRILKDVHARTATREGGTGGPDADGGGFATTVARAFAYDYAGALAASLCFPLLLVPELGLVRTGLAAGAVNALVALGATFLLDLKRRSLLRGAAAVVLAVLGVAFFRADAWAAALTD